MVEVKKSEYPRRLPPPTHKVFYIERDRNGQEGRWHLLGSGWRHPDGEGIELFLDVLPIGGFRGRLRVKPVSYVPPSIEPSTEEAE